MPSRSRASRAASSSCEPGSRRRRVYARHDPLTVGRGLTNNVSLAVDEYASTRHARFEPRRDGVFVEDIGSTNGTFVNGIRVTRERELVPGDVVRIGETDLRFEP